MKNVLDKYLRQYAEPQVQHISDMSALLGSEYVFDNVVVIPAYCESVEFVERFFSSALGQQNALMILVVNQPDSATTNIQQLSLWQDALTLAENKIEWQSCDGKLVLVTPQNSQFKQLKSDQTNSTKTMAKLLLVDCFHEPLPAKQGVGLARKIGVDISAQLVANGVVKSRWLHSSDADASLPDNYFTVTNQLSTDYHIAIYNFDHQCDHANVHWANQLYQQALSYYVSGLRYAGSPYAYYTIGSILAFDVNAYAKVRGFPKRSAGEDFYLLNKLTKLSEFNQEPSTQCSSTRQESQYNHYFFNECEIVLKARTSDRVPFGTGPAVQKILNLKEQGEDYCYYQPQLFEYLKLTLNAFNNLAQRSREFEEWLTGLPEECQRALLAIGFEQFVLKHQGDGKKQFNQQLHTWFDSFKTLKFIHALRDCGYPDIALTEAIKQASWLETNESK